MKYIIGLRKLIGLLIILILLFVCIIWLPYTYEIICNNAFLTAMVGFYTVFCGSNLLTKVTAKKE